MQEALLFRYYPETKTSVHFDHPEWVRMAFRMSPLNWAEAREDIYTEDVWGFDCQPVGVIAVNGEEVDPLTLRGRKEGALRQWLPSLLKATAAALRVLVH